MKDYNKKNYKDDTKLNHEYTEKLVKKCPKCGHSLGFKSQGLDKLTCNYCGTLVFKSKKSEEEWNKRKFRNKLKNEIRKFHIYTFEDITFGQILDNEDKITDFDCESKTLTILEG